LIPGKHNNMPVTIRKEKVENTEGTMDDFEEKVQ
jgi:hypothetical protein